MATNWTKLSLALLGIGFELDVLALAIYRFEGEKGAVEAMNICGFLAYIIALILLMLIVFGDLRGNKKATIAKICFALTAGVFIIIGIAIYGARVNRNPSPYAVTLLAVSAAMALVSGCFCAVALHNNLH